MTRLDVLASRLLTQAPRTAIAESQRRLMEAQAEVVSGRHWDSGLALGSQIGSTITLRIRLDQLTGTMDLTKQAALRADITQKSLSSLSSLAEGFRSMIMGARGAQDGKTLAALSGLSSLDAMRTTLATTYDGQYVFGGLRTDTSPLNSYDSGPRQAIISAFETSFGFPPSDPAAAGLSAADVRNFLDGAFADLFSDAAWMTTWSAASVEGPVFRSDQGGTIDLQTNTNRPFARSLAMAFSMVESLAGRGI
jgi:flagellar hook-associated protein 3 FlgL